LLVDMYAKWRLFNKMPSWNVVTWTAMIGMCEMQGSVEGTGTISMNSPGDV
jgi:hypothetical protein